MRQGVVAEIGHDPDDPKKRRYALACGHTVSRTKRGLKRFADCGWCDLERLVAEEAA